jgi:predicted glycoside hydrolase/deacetylase ChbG (UPF0249 family)
MQPNPVLRKLGLNDRDRVVIIHTDDIGMCQASVEAFADLVDAGWISSGAVMVPCPWFPAAAAYSCEHPEADLGVHVTLTSEWKYYRWRPISTVDPASGLFDEEGFFYHRAAPAQDHVDPSAARGEIDAQVKRALQFGMHPTHMDTHMGTVAHPKIMMSYIQLAIQNHLPPMIFRLDEAGWLNQGMSAETAKMAVQMVADLEGQGIPLLDTLAGMPLDTADHRMERTQQALAALPAGVTHFIIHPSKDTPELRSITPDWACRAADYQVFTDPEMGKFLKNSGLHVIGYRALQKIMK